VENAPKLSTENIFLSNHWIKKISLCNAIKLMARLEKKIAGKVSSLILKIYAVAKISKARNSRRARCH
jgi:hypothetical protein